MFLKIVWVWYLIIALSEIRHGVLLLITDVDFPIFELSTFSKTSTGGICATIALATSSGFFLTPITFSFCNMGIEDQLLDVSRKN